MAAAEFTDSNDEDLREAAREELLRREAAEELERREAAAASACASLAEFFRQAVAAGTVAGIRRLEWGPHLDFYCLSIQLQLESWLVAYGPERDSAEWTAWADRRAEMIGRQREAWERTSATWEDAAPEPWLRYVLAQNQVDNLPPTSLKSTIAMVIANAWIWLHAPRFSFVAASGVEANVDRDSNATRDLVRSAWYRETFSISWSTYNVEIPIDVRKESDAVRLWATTAGGKRDSRTINSGWIGAHGDCLYVDDPDDPDKVFNEADRLKPQNRFTRAMENRTNDDNRSIRRVLQQATHIEDFTAYLLSLARWSPQNPKGWHYNCVPAEYGHGPDDAPAETPYGQRDWRTTKGDTMSARLSPGVLADHKLKRPEYEALYNQNRKRRIGGIFAPRYARFFIWEHQVGQWLRPRPDVCVSREESPPVVVKPSQLRNLTLSIDAANSLDPAPGAKVSAVGLTVNACRGEERLVLDDATRVLGVHGTYRAIFQLAARWSLDRILVEEKALGAGVLAEIMLAIRRGWYMDSETDDRVELLGPDGRRLRCEVEPYKPGKEDKVQRAHGMLPAWQQRLWLLHDGADWLYPKIDESRKTLDEGWIGEVCSFPGSRRSDRVDSESQFSARYRATSDPKADLQAMRRLALVGRRG